MPEDWVLLVVTEYGWLTLGVVVLGMLVMFSPMKVKINIIILAFPVWGAVLLGEISCLTKIEGLSRLCIPLELLCAKPIF